MVTVKPVQGRRCVQCGESEDVHAVKFEAEPEVVFCFSHFSQAYKRWTTPKKVKEKKSEAGAAIPAKV